MSSNATALPTTQKKTAPETLPKGRGPNRSTKAAHKLKVLPEQPDPPTQSRIIEEEDKDADDEEEGTGSASDVNEEEEEPEVHSNVTNILLKLTYSHLRCSHSPTNKLLRYRQVQHVTMRFASRRRRKPDFRG